MPNYYIDPIVEEVRRVRDRIAEECGYDPAKITERAESVVQRLIATGAWSPAPATVTA